MFPLPCSANQVLPGADLPAFRVWVSDPVSARDLVGFLAETAYAAVQIAADTLAVTPPLALDEETARRELAIYLRMWRRRRPGVGVELCP